MFKNLLEISDPRNLRLTDIQKAVLLTVFVAQTPQLAFEATTGSEHIIQSRDFLAQNSLITLSSNAAKITSFGLDTLIANGLIDEMEQVTELGQKLLEWFEVEKRELMESKIPFRHIKSLMNAKDNS